VFADILNEKSRLDRNPKRLFLVYIDFMNKSCIIQKHVSIKTRKVVTPYYQSLLTLNLIL